MNEFTIGDVVQMTGSVMTGNVGIVVWIDDERERYLVRVSAVTQNYFTADELKLYT